MAGTPHAPGGATPDGVEVDHHDRGLDSIDDLCRLVLVAHRLGCRVSIEVGDPALAELLELAGISDLVSSVRCDP